MAKKWIDGFDGIPKRTLQKIDHKIDEIFVYAKRYGLTLKKDKNRKENYNTYQASVKTYFHWIVDTIIPELIEQKQQTYLESIKQQDVSKEVIEKELKKIYNNTYSYASPPKWKSEYFTRYIEELIEKYHQGERGGSAGTIKRMLGANEAFKLFYYYSKEYVGYVKYPNFDELRELLEVEGVIRSKALITSMTVTPMRANGIIQFIQNQALAMPQAQLVHLLEEKLVLSEEVVLTIRKKDVRILQNATPAKYATIRYSENGKLNSIAFSQYLYDKIIALANPSTNPNAPLVPTVQTRSSFRHTTAAILRLQMLTGLRIYSALTLRVKDIVFFAKKGQPDLHGNMPGYLDVKGAKGGKNMRLPFSQETYHFLLVLLREKEAEMKEKYKTLPLHEQQQKYQNSYLFDMRNKKGETLSIVSRRKIVAHLVKIAAEKLGYNEEVQVYSTYKKKMVKINKRITDHSFRKCYVNRTYHLLKNHYTPQQMHAMLDEVVQLQVVPSQLQRRIEAEIKEKNKYRLTENKRRIAINNNQPTKKMPLLPLHTHLSDKDVYLMYVSVMIFHSRINIINYYLT